jgi:hypothetical protein
LEISGLLIPTSSSKPIIFAFQLEIILKKIGKSCHGREYYHY